MLQTETPRIPQNSLKSFKFLKHEKYYSVDVEFDYFSKVSYQNLFLIIKSYIDNDEYLVLKIFMIASEEKITEKKFNTNIFRSIKPGKLKKMKYFEFKDWFDTIKEEDYEYIKTLKYYGFRFVFSPISIAWSESKIYPIYPWKKNLKSRHIKTDINFRKWLYMKNRYLYNKWIIVNKK